MIVKDLYLYKGENGGAIQTLIKIPNADYTPMYRLVADEGMILTKGDIKVSVIDIAVDDKENWTEVVDTETEENAD